MMVRLPPALDQRLAKAAEDMMFPKASLARLLIRRQLDSWDDVTEQEELEHMKASPEARRSRQRNKKKRRK
jgi:predicted DNA-binding protein